MDSQAGAGFISLFRFKSRTTVNKNFSDAGDFYVSHKCESDYVQVALPKLLEKQVLREFFGEGRVLSFLNRLELEPRRDVYVSHKRKSDYA